MHGNGNGNGNGNGHGHRNGWKWWLPFVRTQHRNGADLNQAYRRLSLQLHYDLPRINDTARSVLVVTPTRSSLSARASALLGMSLAGELRRPIILVDASPMYGEVSKLLGCASSNGYAHAVEQGRPFDEMVLPTSAENLLFIPAAVTNALANPAASDSLRPFIDAAAQRCEFVVFSGGAVLDDPLVRALAPNVDCVLLIAEENETKIDDVTAAQEALTRCNARRIALVLTEYRGGKSASAETPHISH